MARGTPRIDRAGAAAARVQRRPRIKRFRGFTLLVVVLPVHSMMARLRRVRWRPIRRRRSARVLQRRSDWGASMRLLHVRARRLGRGARIAVTPAVESAK